MKAAFEYEDTPSPNHSPRAFIPQMLVIHATAGRMPGCLNWLRKRKAKASAHWLIDREGKIYRLVPEEKTAWHCGLSYWRGVRQLNHLSIGIELENRFPSKEGYTDPQIESLISVSKRVVGEWPILYIVGHEHTTKRRRDPGPFFPWKKFRDAIPMHILIGKQGAIKSKLGG